MTDKWDEDTWKTTTHACLGCGYVVDAASDHPLEQDPRAPQEGDVTICLECSHIMIYANNGLGGLTVRNPSQLELDEIASSQDAQLLLQAMGMMRESKLWKRTHAKNR